MSLLQNLLSLWLEWKALDLTSSHMYWICIEYLLFLKTYIETILRSWLKVWQCVAVSDITNLWFFNFQENVIYKDFQ